MISEEKIQLASKMQGFLSKYMKQLDNEIAKFKDDLEVNNSGITDIIEKSKNLKLNLFLIVTIF